jgi:RND family efflux transporter MFP subunit
MAEPENKNQTPSKRRAFYLIGGLAVLLLTLFLLGFFPRYFQRQRLDQAAAKEELPSVVTMQLKPEGKTTGLVLPSSLEAIRVTPIWARTNGYLSDFLVDIGDRVKEGDLLAVIDTPEIDRQVDQAKADLAAAISRREIARITSDRWSELYKHNQEAISVQEVDERKATYDSAVSDVNSAQANLNRLLQIQEFKNIYAPFDGIITERDIDLGSLISAGSNGAPQQLFKIAKVDVLRAFVSVPQYNFRSIHNGLPAEVIIREFPDQIFPGTVVRNAQALDPIARTLLTEVDVDNKDGILVPGLYAEVKFNLSSDIMRFLVPTEAVIIRSGKPQVAILNKDQIVELKTVKIGHDLGSKMEIMDGLNENETIIINPNEKIKEGVRVKILASSRGPS